MRNLLVLLKAERDAVDAVALVGGRGVALALEDVPGVSTSYGSRVPTSTTLSQSESSALILEGLCGCTEVYQNVEVRLRPAAACHSPKMASTGCQLSVGRFSGLNSPVGTKDLRTRHEVRVVLLTNNRARHRVKERRPSAPRRANVSRV